MAKFSQTLLQGLLQPFYMEGLFSASRQAAEPQRKIQEQRKKMLDMIGKDSYNGVNVFEGVEPARESNQHSPLGNISPGDPGVDISKLFNDNWSKLI